MKEFDAYCKYCEMVVKGKTTAVNELESGNYIYIGECLICCYEIRRIIPKVKHIVVD
jgi:Uri superfamily endonuclease